MTMIKRNLDTFQHISILCKNLLSEFFWYKPVLASLLNLYSELIKISISTSYYNSKTLELIEKPCIGFTQKNSIEFLVQYCLYMLIY